MIDYAFVMPKSEKQSSGLLDTWGRTNNRKHQDKTCPECGLKFKPIRKTSHYCSRPCMWANNGGHNRKPETWWINHRGYLEGKIWLDESTQIRVKKHRFIMEVHLGRSLLPTEDVHHKDGNKLNNELSNLEVMTHGAHSSHHNKTRSYAKGYKLNLSPQERDARSVRMNQARAAIEKATL